MKYSRMATNARLGDGCITLGATNRNASIKFTTTSLDLLLYKKRMCEQEGFIVGDIGTQKSGYGGKKTIYKFDTWVNETITKVYYLELTELIDSLDYDDLYLWFLDDGSWHKKKHIMHLYSNMLDDEDTEHLRQRITMLYGVSPRPRKDNKKDGRSFNYLYFPRDLVKRFRPGLKEFVVNNGIKSMHYKFGGLDYKEAV